MALKGKVGDVVEEEPKGEMGTVNNLPVYKAHRIHIAHLMRGSWISTIVTIGERTPLTKDSLTDTTTLVPGEYPSEAEALQAATHYIDHVEKREESSAREDDTPASA